MAGLDAIMIRIKSITKCVVAGVVAILFFAGAPAFAADATAVKIGNFTFGPQELKVKAGTTVTWTNEDDIPARSRLPSRRQAPTNTSVPYIRI